MKIFLATKNKDKIIEFKAILRNLDVNLLTCNDIEIPDVDETGTTFIENAILKAKSAAKATNLPAIADDSGIEVEYLNGKPGVWSARYAGENATNEDNNKKLLKEMIGVPYKNRKACYRCVIVFMRFPDDPFPYIAQDSWEGRIHDKENGKNGFGYDPIFYLPEYRMTSAQLTPKKKNVISHRGKALREFSKYINNYAKN